MACLFFVVHPVHVEAVVGVVGRAEVLCAFFYCLALLAYIASLTAASHSRATPPPAVGGAPRKADAAAPVPVPAPTPTPDGAGARARPASTPAASWLYFGLAVSLTTLAMFSKENGITILAAFAALELLHAGRRDVRACSAVSAGTATVTATGGGSGGLDAAADPREAAAEGGDGGRGGSTAAWLGSLFSGTAPGAGLRGAALAVWVAVVMSYRISVHKGAPLYKWTLLENQMSLMPPVGGWSCAHGRTPSPPPHPPQACVQGAGLPARCAAPVRVGRVGAEPTTPLHPPRTCPPAHARGVARPSSPHTTPTPLPRMLRPRPASVRRSLGVGGRLLCACARRCRAPRVR